MILSSAMTIAVRHVFKPSDDGVFEPEEHRCLADDFPTGKLSGVWSVTDYCIIDQQIMVGKAILENEDVLKYWEKWNDSPEEEKWGQKFSATGKFIKRLIHEIVS